jgi:16S RNA G1207 methylase RsmC
MTHYFTDNRQLSHDRKEITFRFLGVSHIFITDSGVFSKDKVDTGTTVLLEALAKETLSGDILDFGCGYGVIGILLAKLFPVTVMAIDVNERALELTKENATRNKVVIETQLSEGRLQLNHKFSCVILNPPIRTGKEMIYQMFEEAKQHLEETGVFYIVMRKQHGAMSAIKKLQEIFAKVDVLCRDKGFVVVKSSMA